MEPSVGVTISPNDLYKDIREIKDMLFEVKMKLAVQENKDTQVDQRITHAEARLDRLEQKIEERQYQKGFQNEQMVEERQYQKSFQTWLITLTAILGFVSTVGGIFLTWFMTK